MPRRHSRHDVVLLAMLAAMLATIAPLAQTGSNTMYNPYQMLDGWATLPDGVSWGAVIGIIPDGEGGTWVHHRSIIGPSRRSCTSTPPEPLSRPSARACS